MDDGDYKLRRDERVADAAVRGFFAQAIRTARQWVGLTPNEVLICEGNEDADRVVLDENGHIRAVTEFQFKELADRISIRDVKETLFNFLVAFHEHDVAGRSCRLIFATPAEIAKQKADDLYLVDVLATWPEGPTPELVRTIRNMVPAGGSASEVEQAIAYLDQSDGWARFIPAVDWRMGESTFAAERIELQAELAGQGLPTPKILGDRLVIEVLRASSKPDWRERQLTRKMLDAILATTNAELEAWWNDVGASRFADGLTALQAQIEELRAELQPEAVLRRSLEIDRDRLMTGSSDSLDAVFADQEVPGFRRLTIPRNVGIELAHELENKRRVILVGPAGAGKTAAAATWADGVRCRGATVIWLEAASTPASTLAGWGRDLGLENDVLSVLRSFPSDTTNVLVVDAAEGARDPRARRLVSQLLRQLVKDAPTWSVVVTMRDYDYEQDESSLSTIVGTCKVNVTAFSDDEMAALASEHERLAELMRTGTKGTEDLLRLPFHVRLIAELLGQGIPMESLSSITDQVSLLQVYWRRRVATINAADAREGALTRLIQRMLETRTLVADRTGLTGDDSMTALLSEHVLEPANRSGRPDEGRIRFRHDLLFDYAVFELLLRRGPLEAAITRATDAGYFVVGLAPSWRFLCTDGWHADASRARYWRLVFTTMASALPAALKVVALEPALRSASALDVAILQAAVSNSVGNERTAVTDALHHACTLFLAALTVPEKRSTIRSFTPWIALTATLANDAGEHCDLRESARRLALAIAMHGIDSLDSEDRRRLRAAGARLIETTGADDDWGLAHAGAEALCNGLSDADVDEVRGCWSRLTSEGTVSSRTVVALSRHAAAIAALAPDVAVGVCRAAFQLTGRADYGVSAGPMYLTEEAELDLARREWRPQLATIARTASDGAFNLFACLARAHREGGSFDAADPPRIQFTFRGVDVMIRDDLSALSFDTDDSPSAEAVRVVVSALCEASAEARRELLDVIARYEWPASFWVHIMTRAVDEVEMRPLAVELWEPLCSAAFLGALSMTTAAGELIRSTFSELSIDVREQVERAIIALREKEKKKWSEAEGLRRSAAIESVEKELPSEKDGIGENFAELEQDRDSETSRDVDIVAVDQMATLDDDDINSGLAPRLLGCIPARDLLLPESQELRRRLEVVGVPENAPLMGKIEAGFLPIDPNEHAIRKGADLDNAAHVDIIQLTREAEAYASAMESQRRDKGDEDDLPRVVPDLTRLLELLRDEKELPKYLRRWGAKALVDAAGWATAASAAREFSLDALEFLRQAFPPEPYDGGGGGSWSEIDPRIYGASSALRLSTTAGDSLEEQLRDAIVDFARDEDPRVRAQVARWLNALSRVARDLMWQLFTELAQGELDDAVLRQSAPALLRGMGEETDRAVEVVCAVMTREDLRRAPGSARQEYAGIAAHLAVRREDPVAIQLVDDLLVDPLGNRAELTHILYLVRAKGDLTLFPDHDGIRRRAFRLFHDIASKIIEVSPPSDGKIDEHGPDLLDKLSNQLCFAVTNSSGLAKGTEDALRSFFDDAGKTIALVASSGLRRQSPRYFAQLLATYASIDTNRALEAMGAFIVTNRASCDSSNVAIFEKILTSAARADSLSASAKGAASELADIYLKLGHPRAAVLADLAAEAARQPLK